MDKLVKATNLNVRVGDILVSSKTEDVPPWLAVVFSISGGIPFVGLKYNDEASSQHWYRLRHLSQLYGNGGVCFIIGNLYETAFDKEVVDSWLAGMFSK